ncbi:MAG: hypothetical protein IJQ53_01370 [Clostridia bacterium]|nr:hypothetical protein [Clostridia bacterium]
MKKMKQILALMLAVLMLVPALAACSRKNEEPTIETGFLTSDVDQVSSAIDSLDLTLSLASGKFADTVGTADVVLGGSFKNMTVSSVKADGGKLTLSLTGSPVLQPEISSVYTAGEIKLPKTAFKQDVPDQSVYINVQPAVIGVDLSGVKENSDSATFPVKVLGMETAGITAADVSFDGNGAVTDVTVQDDTVFVTVKAAGNLADLSGNLRVGDADMMVSLTHAAVNTIFDYIEADGSDLIITLNLYTVSGSLASGFGPDSFTLEMDYTGGKVDSVNVTDDSHAEVKIRFPANGMTDEDYAVAGVFELKEGALLDENGSPAPAFTYARQYVPEEMGRADSVVFEFGDISITESEKNAFSNAIKYGKSLYTTISSAVSGKWGNAFSGAVSFLKLVGVLDAGPAEVTNADLKKEIEATQKMISAMSEKLDANIKQTYQNRLVPFETAMGVLDTDCSLIEAKLKIARDELEKQGVFPYVITSTSAYETREFTDEEASEYTKQLIAYCEAQEKAGNSAFKKFTGTMDELEAKYKEVAAEAAKVEASSPFYAYDSYWDMYFNFHSQSYFLRAGYYANCETLLKRAYNLLALYYNIPANQESYQALTDKFNAAVTAIESRELGRDPSLDLGYYDNPKTYSPTLQGYYKGVLRTDTNTSWGYSDSQISEYLKRLHGKSIEYDLRSAGLFLEINGKELTTKNTIGLAFKGEWYDTGYRSWFRRWTGYHVYRYTWEGVGPNWICTYDSDPTEPEHNNILYYAELWNEDY